MRPRSCDAARTRASWWRRGWDLLRRTHSVHLCDHVVMRQHRGRHRCECGVTWR